jgi:hypothetical protein
LLSNEPNPLGKGPPHPEGCGLSVPQPSPRYDSNGYSGLPERSYLPPSFLPRTELTLTHPSRQDLPTTVGPQNQGVSTWQAASPQRKVNIYPGKTGFQRFPLNNFKYFLTLFSKFFSSFPHGTCSLSVSRRYLALEEIYLPFRAGIPTNSTL